MAYAFNVSDCSLQLPREVNTPADFTSKSVVVKNLSPITKVEDVIIHFQRSRNGGGEVECVRLLSKGTAVVTFEKSTVVESVLKRRHEINGSLVALELYRQSIPNQVFGSVSGRLDPNTFGVGSSTMKTILQKIQDETKVEWKEIFDGFVVTGTFEQIKRVNDVLKTKLKENPQKNVFPVRYSEDAQGIGHRTSAPRSKLSTNNNKLPTSVSEKIRVKAGQSDRKRNIHLTERETQETVNSKPSTISPIDPNERPLSVPEKSHEKQNQSYIKVTSNAYLNDNELNANVLISETGPRVAGNALPLSKAKVSDVGINGTNKQIQSQEEAQQHCDVKTLAKNLDQDTRKPNNLRSQFRDEIRKDSKSSVRDLHSEPTFNKARIHDQEQVREKPETVKCCIETKELLHEKQERVIVEGSHYEFITVTGLTILLLKGDITSQHVDVLLSPANPTLSYEKGLSELILEKGGQAIKDECLSLTQDQGPLKHGYTVITTGGNLPCQAVLHAVLPSWNNAEEEQKKCKRYIHKCLKEGLVLSSGYRLKSIALPPLGQHWNDIPVAVSAEVIVRVVAAFAKSISPIHGGINDFRIVCEDDATIDVFLKEVSSFSFHQGQLFFASVPSKSKLVNADKTGAPPVFQSKTRNGKNGENGYSSMPKESSGEQIQKASSTPSFVSVIHTNTRNAMKPASALQSSEKTIGNENAPDGVEEDSNNGRNKAATPSFEKQVCEKTISHVSSSSVERIQVSEIKAFEILQVSSAVRLVEETMKSMVVQDESHFGEYRKSDVFVGDALNLNEGEKRREPYTWASAEETADQIAQKMVHNFQQSQLKDFTSREERNGNSPWPKTDIQCQHGTPIDSTGLYALNDGLFTSSPTVDGVLNANLRLRVQSLELWNEHHFEDRLRRSKHVKDIKDDNKGNKSVLTFQESKDTSKEMPSSIFNTHAKTIRTRMPFEKPINKDVASNNWNTGKQNKEDVTKNLVTKAISGLAEKQEESVQKDDFAETKQKDDEIMYGDHPESNVSDRHLSILCALCQDTVDHPDLTNPHVCMKHKFCDDCILKAFTISSSCPACTDTAGLVTTDKENVNQNQHIHLSSSNSSFRKNQDDKTRRTGTPDLIQTNQPPGQVMRKTYETSLPGFENLDIDSSRSTSSSHQNQGDNTRWTDTSGLVEANQPPGQMMWKKYDASLPGFENYGTIAVRFVFYDGIQSIEHPNPGENYKGTTCVAYIPETKEGRHILKLLRKAFDARLVFTVSSSASDGTGYVSLNDIELKTSVERNSRNGYPDAGYLSRVRNHLAGKGIC